MRFFIAAYPWDLMGASIDDVLDRMRGELGITGLAVHVACPSAIQLRIDKVEPRIVRSRGGLFFPPSPEGYQATRCKPVVSSRVGKSDPLAGWVRACASRDLDLRVVISAAATGRMAERYPDAACKNVYGDVSRVSVCLSNPDVQAYLVDLVADVSARAEVGDVCLDDFVVAWYEACSAELAAPLPLSESDRMLLSMCFCESCQQRAMECGVDPVIARRAVQLALDARFEGGAARGGSAMAGRKVSEAQAAASPGETMPHDVSSGGRFEGDFAALCEANKAFARYVEERARALAGLLDRLTDACRCGLLVRTSDGGFVGAQHRALFSGDGDLSDRAAEDRPDRGSGLRTRPAGLYDLGLIPSGHGEMVIPSFVREVSVRSALHEEVEAPQLVSLVARASECGVRGVMFEHFGMWNGAALRAIKQAVRFARRTAGT